MKENIVFIYSNEVGSDQSVSYLNFFRFVSERQNSSEIQKDTDVYKIKICKSHYTYAFNTS